MDIPDSEKNENDDTKVEDDKANQLEETKSVEITRFQGKQALLTRKRKSDSDIPDSKKDEDDVKKIEDDKANQLEGTKSLELTKLPRKQG